MKFQPPFGAAADAPYVNGNPVAGIEGSIPPGEAIEHPQRELVAVIEAGGMTASATDLTQVQKAVRSQRTNWLVAGGTANAITMTPTPAFGALADLVGVPLRLLALAANTGPVTINVSWLGAIPLTWPDGTAYVAGDIPAAGYPVHVMYDGTAFRGFVELSPTQVRAIAGSRGRPTQAFIAPAASNVIPSGGAATKITNYGAIINGLSDVATWDASNKRLIATVAGWYRIDVTLTSNLPVQNGSGQPYGVSYSLGLNGAASITGNNIYTSSAMVFGPFGSASRLMLLGAGDYIEAYAAHNYGSNLAMPIQFSAEYRGT